MNELLDLARKLYDEYGSGKHWEIVKAEKTGQFENENFENENNGWNLTIKAVEKPIKDGGAENESNK